MSIAEGRVTKYACVRRRLSTWLREPALSSTIVFHIAKRLASGAREAEIEFFHVLVLRELGCGAIHDHAPVFQDISIVGEAQRDIGVLLGEKEAHLFLLIQIADDLEYLLDDL